MADMKPRLGEALRMTGSGMVRKTAEEVIKEKKKKKSRLDEIMSDIESGRKSK